jgi:hypothetical protein
VDKSDLQYVAFKVVKATQRSSLVHKLHLKVDSSQQGTRSSCTPPEEAASNSQPTEAEKTTGDRNRPAVKNLLLTEVTPLAIITSGTPPHGCSSSRITVD